MKSNRGRSPERVSKTHARGAAETKKAHRKEAACKRHSAIVAAIRGALQTTRGGATGIQRSSQDTPAESRETQCRNLLWSRYQGEILTETENQARNLLWNREKNDKDAFEQCENGSKGSEEVEKTRGLRIISANIHSLRPRAEIVAAWQTDVAVIQETKLAPHAIAETATVVRDSSYRMAHGLPCQP